MNDIILEFKKYLNKLLSEDVTSQIVAEIQFIDQYGWRVEYKHHGLEDPESEYWKKSDPFMYSKKLNKLEREKQEQQKRLSQIESAMELQDENERQFEATIKDLSDDELSEVDRIKRKNFERASSKLIKMRNKTIDRIQELNKELREVKEKSGIKIPETHIYEGDPNEMGGTIVLTVTNLALSPSSDKYTTLEDDEEDRKGWKWLKKADDTRISPKKDIERGEMEDLPERFKDPSLFKSPPRKPRGKGPHGEPGTAEEIGVLAFKEMPDLVKYFNYREPEDKKEEYLKKFLMKAENQEWPIESALEFLRWKYKEGKMTEWGAGQERFVGGEYGYEEVPESPWKTIYKVIYENFKPDNVEVSKEVKSPFKEFGHRRYAMGFDINRTVFFDIGYLFDEKGNPTRDPIDGSVDQHQAFHKAIYRAFHNGPSWFAIDGDPESGEHGDWVIYGKMENIHDIPSTPVEKHIEKLHQKKGEKGAGKIREPEINDVIKLYKAGEPGVAKNKALEMWNSKIAELANIITNADRNGLIKVTNPKITEISVLSNVVSDYIYNNQPKIGALDPSDLKPIQMAYLFKDGGALDDLVAEMDSRPRMLPQVADATETIYTDEAPVPSEKKKKKKKMTKREIRNVANEILSKYKRRNESTETRLNVITEGRIDGADSIWRIIRDHSGITENEISMMAPENMRHNVSKMLNELESSGFIKSDAGKYFVGDLNYRDRGINADI